MAAVIMRSQVYDEQKLLRIVRQAALEDALGVVQPPLARVHVVQLAVAGDESFIVLEQVQINLLRFFWPAAGDQGSCQRDQHVGLKRPDRGGGSELIDRRRQVCLDLWFGCGAPGPVPYFEHLPSAFYTVTGIFPGWSAGDQ